MPIPIHTTNVKNFPRACAFTFVASAACRLFDTCCHPAIQSLVVPTGRMVFLLIQICNSPRVMYLVNQFATLCTETTQRVTVLDLSSLKTYHNIFVNSCLPDHIRHGFQGQ